MNVRRLIRYIRFRRVTGTGVDRFFDGWCRFCRGVRLKFYADKFDVLYFKLIG